MGVGRGLQDLPLRGEELLELDLFGGQVRIALLEVLLQLQKFGADGSELVGGSAGEFLDGGDMGLRAGVLITEDGRGFGDFFRQGLQQLAMLRAQGLEFVLGFAAGEIGLVGHVLQGRDTLPAAGQLAGHLAGDGGRSGDDLRRVAIGIGQLADGLRLAASGHGDGVVERFGFEPRAGEGFDQAAHRGRYVHGLEVAGLDLR